MSAVYCGFTLALADAKSSGTVSVMSVAPLACSSTASNPCEIWGCEQRLRLT